MRIAQNISKDEQEWLKEFDELRNKLDEGERVLQAEKRGKYNRDLELIHRWKSEGKSLEEIAGLLHKEVSEIETILKLEP